MASGLAQGGWDAIARCCSQVTLNNGIEMPLVGFGSAGLGQDTKQAVKWALEAGYRLIDSAQVCSLHAALRLASPVDRWSQSCASDDANVVAALLSRLCSTRCKTVSPGGARAFEMSCDV